LRFNAKNDGKSSSGSNSFPNPNDNISTTTINPAFEFNSRLIAVDTIKMDENSRLTFTKKVKGVFPIRSGDTIGVYQDKYNNDELTFKIQRGNSIIDNWVVKRKHIGGIDNKNANDSNLTSATSVSSGFIDKNSTESSDVNPSIYSDIKNKLANIMLVDDEQDVLYSFKAVLSSHGYYVKAFAQSKEALKHLVDLKNPFSFYNLVIIDIRMPDINGIQLYQILKAMNKNIKVLFISALDVIEEAVSLFPEIQPDNIMRKPISQTYLLDKVKEIISH
jgi:CheY-like chemotaxis protein